MTITDMYMLYLMITVLSIVIFGATMLIQIQKFRKKRNPLHFWASTAFLTLLIQEIIVGIWIIQILSFIHLLPIGASASLIMQEIASKPWHLQALSVLFSLMMLGLSMSGKIFDRALIRRKNNV